MHCDVNIICSIVRLHQQIHCCCTSFSEKKKGQVLRRSAFFKAQFLGFSRQHVRNGPVRNALKHATKNSNMKPRQKSKFLFIHMYKILIKISRTQPIHRFQKGRVHLSRVSSSWHSRTVPWNALYAWFTVNETTTAVEAAAGKISLESLDRRPQSGTDCAKFIYMIVQWKQTKNTEKTNKLSTGTRRWNKNGNWSC